LLFQFLPVGVRTRGVIDQRKLQQSAKHERQTNTRPHVNSLYNEFEAKCTRAPCRLALPI
jgi:hypothetical protein